MTQGERRILRAFEHSGKAFIPYLVTGDPDQKAGRRIMAETFQYADLAEMGLPFSDPLADGPDIQKGDVRALGTRSMGLKNIISEARHLKGKGIKIPLLLMTYANPLFSQMDLITPGRSRTSSFPFDGILVPDLPWEESGPLRRAVNKAGAGLIQLVAPTTSPKRLRQITESSQGFVYLVSVSGVTGRRKKLPTQVLARTRQVRRIARLPVAVGFGVSSPATAHAVARVSDGVVVGSALVHSIEKAAQDRKNIPKAVGRFAQRLSNAVHRAAKR